MAPPAPVARVGGVFDGFLALPNNPMAVELGFIFGGSETDRSEGIRLGLSASKASPDSAPPTVPCSEGASPHTGNVGAAEPLDCSISSGVAGIESEPLIAAREAGNAMKQTVQSGWRSRYR
jgi:hypothetical protein